MQQEQAAGSSLLCSFLAAQASPDRGTSRSFLFVDVRKEGMLPPLVQLCLQNKMPNRKGVV